MTWWTIDELAAQEEELVLPGFDHDDAWRLGSIMQRIASSAGQGAAIDIRRPGLVMFRAVLPGVAPDQDVWLERKAALVLRIEASGALFSMRAKERGVDPRAIGWLDERYAIGPGGFPIRVRGVGVVAAASVSGLSAEDDHDLIVAGLREYLATLPEQA
jgi:uncharacterized protein (UPF0303 family)